MPSAPVASKGEKIRKRGAMPMLVPQPAELRKFTFINVSEPKQIKDKNVLRVVRSNAMRTYSYRQKERRKAIYQRAQQPHETQRDDSQRLSLDAAKVTVDRPAGCELVVAEVKNMLQLPVQPLGIYDDSDEENPNNPAWTHSPSTESSFYNRPPTGESVIDPKQQIGDGMSDPFDTFPSDGCPRYNSYVLNHFVNLMARRCLPIDPDNGSNPLARVWVPYALTDPLLFLATLNFAAVHYDIMRGEYNNPMTLQHKIKTIRSVNARLEDPKASLTNEMIGSVAMLAAVESLSGNCDELHVHMDALVKMVEMRGGLQELGWGGVLHMFIWWQDLLSSAMMASPPHFARTPYCRTLNSDLPFPCTMTAAFSTIDRSAQFCAQMTAIFKNIRHLTTSLTSWGQNISTSDLMSSCKMRSALEHWLLGLKIRKLPEEMMPLDYELEAYRLAALIYLKCVLHTAIPVCAILRNLKKQLMSLIREGEGSFFDDVNFRLRLGGGSMMWVMFMGGILSLDEEEKTFFAERIAKLVKTWHSQGPKTWHDIEDCLRQISWMDSLRTRDCVSLWNKAERIWGRTWAS